MSEEIEKIKQDLLLKRLSSPEELQAWLYTYIDIKFPLGTVYPNSTHSPVEAMWRVYELFLNGDSKDSPQVAMLSSRDSYKTLCASAIMVLLMTHFRIQLATAGAIKAQSDKMIQYIAGHFRKMTPYLEANGWQKLSESKSRTDWLDENGGLCFIRVVVATVAGMNCVSPNTLIRKEDGEIVPAKDIRIGDKLLTFNYWDNSYKKIDVRGTGNVFKHSRKITFENENSIIVSDDHQIFTNKGWILAEKIRPGYKCFLNKLNKDRIIQNEKVETQKPEWSLKQMVLGTLIGDASINVLPSGSCRYQVFHCDKQKEYIYATANVFDKHNIRYNICKDGNGLKLTTQTHLYFKIANKIIKNSKNKKRLSKEWLSKINNEGLAFVLMDDGDCHRGEISSSKEYNINFSLMGFPESDLDLFIDYLDNIGLVAYKTGHNGYINIRLEKESSRSFSTMVKPYVLPELGYKLLSSNTSNLFTRYIDTGEACYEQTHNNGFTWSDSLVANRKVGRDFRVRIKEQLDLEVTKVELLGLQELIDIHIDVENEHERSFFANDVLVHNSEHVPFLAVDEVDVVQDPRALEEGKMIPCVFKNSLGETFFPVTLYLSTRKYAGGLMEATLKDTIRSGGEILRWNIVDVTERITPEEAKVDEPKVLRYISRELPMRNLSPEDFEQLGDDSKTKYEAFEAYAGIAEHPMLSVMKNYLVDRPITDVGDLYKPLPAVHNNFTQTSPEMGEAQLLCNKPSSSGLVYPNFDTDENAISIDEAWEYLSGDEVEGKTFKELIAYMHNLGIEFYGGADWGNTDETALGVFAKITGGKSWLIDLYSAPGMEIPEIKDKVKEMTEYFNVKKWFCDSNYPAYIKMLRKTQTEKGRISAIGVKKGRDSVIDGIACVQSKIVDAKNNRHFKVLKTKNTQRVFDSFEVYKWMIDGQGNPIDGKPQHGKDGTADIMDMIRYFFHSMFGKGSKVLFSYDLDSGKRRPENLRNKIDQLTGSKGDGSGKKIRKKGIILDM